MSAAALRSVKESLSTDAFWTVERSRGDVRIIRCKVNEPTNVWWIRFTALEAAALGEALIEAGRQVRTIQPAPARRRAAARLELSS